MISRTLYKVYLGRIRAARGRGIDFQLTFDEWLQIWLESGHLAKAGKKRGQYVMARYGDIGPYAVGNVRIITAEENTREAWQNSMELRRARLSEGSKGKTRGPRPHLYALNLARRGKPRSPEWCEQHSQWMKSAWRAGRYDSIRRKNNPG